MKAFTKRINIIGFLFLLFGALITWRLFDLQVLNSAGPGRGPKAEAVKNNFGVEARGEIYMKDKDGNLEPLAINKEINVAYLGPRRKKEEAEPLSYVGELAEILEMPEQSIEEKLKFSQDYLILKKGLTDEQVSKLNSLNLDFIDTGKDTVRFYPQGELAAHVVGFLGFEGDQRKGQYGLESYYDRPLVANRSTSTDDKLVTNIDYNIQFKARQVLENAVEEYEAEGGSIIVADPKDGSIIAMAALPSFDPNEYGEYEFGRFLNPTISNQYEPGSVFKAITMAGGLEEGVVTPATTYYDKSYIRVADRVIHNAMDRSFGTSTMVDVLKNSINTGAVFVQQQLSLEKFRQNVESFGFGQETGIDLSWEASGNILNLFTRRTVNFATASFGQGISVTPIQLVRAFSAIANGGKLTVPQVVDWEQSTIPRPNKLNKRGSEKAVSQETASRLTSMLVEVIDDGDAHRTKLETYRIAGKTGTAQVPKEGAAGYSEKTVHNFVAFAPAYEPHFVILVKLNNPRALRFSAGTTVWVFKEMAQYILNYWEVPPTR